MYEYIYIYLFIIAFLFVWRRSLVSCFLWGEILSCGSMTQWMGQPKANAIGILSSSGEWAGQTNIPMHRQPTAATDCRRCPGDGYRTQGSEITPHAASPLPRTPAPLPLRLRACKYIYLNFRPAQGRPENRTENAD